MSDDRDEVHKVLDQIHALVAPFGPANAALMVMAVFAAVLTEMTAEEADRTVNSVATMLEALTARVRREVSGKGPV